MCWMVCILYERFDRLIVTQDRRKWLFLHHSGKILLSDLISKFNLQSRVGKSS
ncbi:hypothetical protein AALO_G00250630, partial [Alosa alosa]